MKRTRAALFARYSSKLQDSLSLDAQVSEMERHCQKEGWEITHRFLLPETRSALIDQADEFQAMVKAAKDRKFDTLVLHKLDRFGRDRETTVMYKALLRRHGVKIFSLTEKLGESPYERMVEGFMEVIAEFYSLNLAQETRKGQRAATRAGRWTGGKPPFGYRRGEGEDGKSILVPHAEEAAIVREVFEKYAAGLSSKQLVDWIHAATGKKWASQTLLKRLGNPTYKGVLRYGITSLSAKGRRTRREPEELVTGSCHALVSEELWESVQSILRRHKKRNKRAVYPYLLAKGTMTCSACGSDVVGAFGGGKGYKYPYYQCPGWAKGTCTRQKATRADILDELVRKEGLQIVSDVHETRCLENHSLGSEEMDLRRSELTALLTSIEASKDNLLEFIMAGVGEQGASISAKLQELEQREATIRKDLANLDAQLQTRTKQTKLDSLLAYVNKHPGSREWKGVIDSLFRLSWDFNKKTGILSLVDWADVNGPPLVNLASIDLENQSVFHVSTRVDALEQFVSRVKELLEKNRRVAQMRAWENIAAAVEKEGE